MRAVVLSEFGPPEVLVGAEVADPVATPGRVVIDVEVASITFVETQVRAGRPPHPSMSPQLPAILGNGVGGRVLAVGADVDPALVGTEVVSTTGGSGGYAERAAAEASGLIAVPGGLELRDAVAVLADGRTAIGLMRAAKLRPGESALVEAAGGGVGTLLVQLARAAGANVVASARGEHKLELARELGAEATADYSEAGWADALGDGVDVVFDGVGGAVGQAAFALIRPGGRFLPFGMASGEFAGISGEDGASREVTIVAGGRRTPQELSELTRAALTETATGRPNCPRQPAVSSRTRPHRATRPTATASRARHSPCWRRLSRSRAP